MQDVRSKQIITFIMPSKTMRCAVASSVGVVFTSPSFHSAQYIWSATLSDSRLYECVSTRKARHEKKRNFFSRYNSKLIISGILKIGVIITNLLAPKQRNENDSNRLKNAQRQNNKHGIIYVHLVRSSCYSTAWFRFKYFSSHFLLPLSKVVVSDAA